MEELYKRFGIDIDRKKAELIFKNKIENLLIHGQLGDGIFKNNKIDIIWEISNKLGIEYKYASYNRLRVDNILRNLKFSDYLLRLQCLLDILWDYGIEEQCTFLGDTIQNIVEDYPILELKLKIYKTKSPQILLSISKKFDKEISDTLGLLDNKELEDTLIYFEAGLKNFITAKTKPQFKSVANDMHSACDEIVKIILGDANKSFKNICNKEESKKLGLNGHQKEISKNLKNWIDSIKHGSIKNYNRDDIEMIISITAAFLRFIIKKYELRK